LVMNKISPFLWFVDDSEEAANFYVKIFPDSKIQTITRYPKSAEKGSGRPAGSVMTVDLSINGTDFTFLNGGKIKQFSDPSNMVSFTILCDDQAEVDRYWDAFSDGGKPIACGWIQDKFGVMWQVVPKILPEYLKSDDPELVDRVVACYMKMVKYDIDAIEAAAKG
jgi:predicted 3-demethylubiquinone-9 3-methyltransferase (glyoxalase superfamily)